MPKKKLATNDGMGDWEVIEQKRETIQKEKAANSSDSDNYSDLSD